MALDGIALQALSHELYHQLVGGRVEKLYQPEKDELHLMIHHQGNHFRLLMTAQASMPRLHLSHEHKKNPATPSAYCMLLRKHLVNATLIDIDQVGLERIIRLTFRHKNEMGDDCLKRLIIEIMGKHSNIILADEQGLILESIKRVSTQMSSVRQIYPGLIYQLPPDQAKVDFRQCLTAHSVKDLFPHQAVDSQPLYQVLYQRFTGFSPWLSDRLCVTAGLDPSIIPQNLTNKELTALIQQLQYLNDELASFSQTTALIPAYQIIDANGGYGDFHVIQCLRPVETVYSDSFSELIDNFYRQKSQQVRLRQKSADLRHHTQNLMDRCRKKLDLQERQYRDTDNMNKFKLKGELLMAYQYQLPKQTDQVTVFDYHSGKDKRLTLDPELTVQDNAKQSFDKYNKKKRTRQALDIQLEHTRQQLSHLESIAYAIDSAEDADDFDQIKQELRLTGYFKQSLKLNNQRANRKKNKPKTAMKKNPHHFLSPEGYHFYVGRNNQQNEELALRLANNNDWWFHAKGIPGSHVIVKLAGQELTDKAFEQAAALAAYYSKGRDSLKVDVDYTRKKELKKPKGSPPGFVIYHTNYSMTIQPSIDKLKRLD